MAKILTLLALLMTAVTGAWAQAPAPDPIELTSTDGKTWTLSSMPGYEVALEVEYETALALSETTNNSAALTEWNGYEADVTLTRTLVAGVWNTFCAPFAIADPATVFGNGAKVRELDDTSIEDGNVLSLNFANATSIVAGKPYLVKISLENNVDLSTVPFNDVIISETAQQTVTTYVNFVPTLGMTEVTGVPEDILILNASSKLVHPTSEVGNMNMKGFRGYFVMHEAANLARAFRIDFGDGEATGIIPIRTEGSTAFSDNMTYDLQGRRINGQPTQKGVYIQNGKKVIIK